LKVTQYISMQAYLIIFQPVDIIDQLKWFRKIGPCKY